MNNLKKDLTPKNFYYSESTIAEHLVNLTRCLVYKFLSTINQYICNIKFKDVNWGLEEPLFQIGQRGNDYLTHRIRVNKLKRIRGSTLLIIGVGLGQDLESWARYNPKKIIAIDIFNYGHAWNLAKKSIEHRYSTKVEFHQCDAKNISFIPDKTIDIIGSDAVFEHLPELDLVLYELKRVLTKNGILYANFGPLWSTFGGDTLSGRDKLSSGFNHITLDPVHYDKYVRSMLSESDHRKIYHDHMLFCKYTYNDYIRKLKGLGLTEVFLKLYISNDALSFFKNCINESKKLLTMQKYADSIVFGMTMIYRNE